MVLPPKAAHPEGDVKLPEKNILSSAIEVSTYGGKIHVE
jgi:hypothetical protein